MLANRGMRSSTLITSLLALGALAACSNDLSRESAVSACGGFAQSGQALVADLKGDPATYCEAERLLWAYFPATQTLELSNNRILLNCCGKHELDVTLDGTTYVITETDAPEFGDARCGCSCVFDYAAAVDGVPAGQVDLRIIRDVTDDDAGPAAVWEGSIDTTTSTGAVDITTGDIDPWCGGE